MITWDEFKPRNPEMKSELLREIEANRYPKPKEIEVEVEMDELALVDLDGTLADYDAALKESMAKLKSPDERDFFEWDRKAEPEYLKNRMDLIRSDVDWWINLKKFKLGWDVLAILNELDFDIMVLTQGPRKNSNAWKGKVEWCLEHLPGVDIDITRKKAGRYGKVLVDDFPEYVEGWLKHRSRGLVIMPAQKWNMDFKHPQVIRYDGTNLDEVRNALVKVRRRKAKEPLEI